MMSLRDPQRIKKTNKSAYGDRETVGKIYRDLQIHGDKARIEVGNLTEEISKGLVEDLNETILSKPYGDRPFFIQIHEKKDLAMKNAICRTIKTYLWRPWPEDDTIVFKHDPKAFVTYFCWCLPHWAEMKNMLSNAWLYDKEMLATIRDWEDFRMERFGFMKNDEGNWIENKNFRDPNIETYKHKSSLF